MKLSHFEDAFRHMEWADARIWQAVLSTKTAAKESYVLDTFKHIHETQHAFLDVWMNRPFKRANTSEFETAELVLAWAKNFYDQLPALFETLSRLDLESPCVLPWAKYFGRSLGIEPRETTLRETLHQLTSHSMHHRGQLVRRLREIGETPPNTDYIMWVWSGRPEAEWPSI